MSLLSVNVDMVATIREIRGTTEPDPAQAAVLAELAGAEGVTVQLRRQGHVIRDRDLYVLKGIVKTRLTVELPPVEELIAKVLDIKPWMAVLFADHLAGGGPPSTLDLAGSEVDYRDLSARLAAAGVNAAFFVEPEPDAIKHAAKAGAKAVLINCAGYADARTIDQAQTELDRVDRAVAAAVKAGLAVHCGRGLNTRNLTPLAELGTVDEFVIGHGVCARAMLVGFERAVQELLQITRRR